MNKDGIIKVLVIHFAVLSTAGAVAAAVQRRYRRRRKETVDEMVDEMVDVMADVSVMPKFVLTDIGRVQELERFSHYVARQLGFEDFNECPQLLKLSDEYMRKKKGYEENMFAFFAKHGDAETLYMKLFKELDTCLMAYFAFHWSHAPLVISQVLSTEGEKKRLKSLIMDATRKQRFERITKNLKITRLFSTLLEEMKAIGLGPTETICSDVMVPAAHKDRSPVLLLMGGGMGAGKSTVLQDILKEAFWAGAAKNAVVVEADAFKETDVIYRAISSFGHHNDMLQTAELVHQSSTDAASSLLVTALNEGRDVIMDGTLSWEPFVQQTIAMARNVHHQRYRMGVGYKVEDDGTVTENYWEPVEGDNNSSYNGNSEDSEAKSMKPYRIEMVGVVCDAYLAVIRGIRRAIVTGRAVRVKSQLKSHQRFAELFPRYCSLVDNARLYSTNSMGSYKLIGWKDGSSSLLVEPQEITCLEKLKNLNDNANSVYELYPGGDTICGSSSIWNENVLSPARRETQKELKEAIKIIESQAL